MEDLKLLYHLLHARCVLEGLASVGVFRWMDLLLPAPLLLSTDARLRSPLPPVDKIDSCVRKPIRSSLPCSHARLS